VLDTDVRDWGPWGRSHLWCSGPSHRVRAPSSRSCRLSAERRRRPLTDLAQHPVDEAPGLLVPAQDAGSPLDLRGDPVGDAVGGDGAAGVPESLALLPDRLVTLEPAGPLDGHVLDGAGEVHRPGLLALDAPGAVFAHLFDVPEGLVAAPAAGQGQ